MNVSWWMVAGFVALLGAMTLTANAITLVFAGLALWALKGSSASVRAMCLAVIVKFLNPVLFTFTSAAGGLFWLVLLIAIVRLAPALRKHHIPALLPIWAFAALAALLSIIASLALTISLMKLAAFVLIVTSVMVAIQSLAAEEHRRLTRWFNALAIAIAGLSALTLFRPDAAFLAATLSTGTGLRGIFNHPQTLGIFLAPFVARDTAGFLLMRGVSQWTQIAVTGCMWAVMFLTQARTAAIAATLGVVAATGMRMLKGRKIDTQAGMLRVVGIVTAAAFAIVIATVTSAQLSQAVTGFLLKREGANNISTAFYASRGAGMEIQWDNFLSQPLTGHGFGVYANGQFPDGVVEFAGIPISAPVEKGFVPTTLLEETGIFGFLLFGLVAVRLVMAAWQNVDFRWFAVLVACLMVNVGEAVILSPSGNGLLVWVLIGLCTTAPRVLGQDRTGEDASALPDPTLHPPTKLRPANLME